MVVTVCVLVLCRDKERLEKVLATYTDLRGAGLAPTTTTHNVVIAAFLDLGDFSHALAQYRVMEAEGVLPDKVGALLPRPLCKPW